jgi:hypothetical protein
MSENSINMLIYHGHKLLDLIQIDLEFLGGVCYLTLGSQEKNIGTVPKIRLQMFLHPIFLI